uniref:Uncharacterized protein n=1 Tax=Rhipicephalus appendiculatus TaxID=34631 RepID=A0A131YBT9_RHIAP
MASHNGIFFTGPMVGKSTIHSEPLPLPTSAFCSKRRKKSSSVMATAGSVTPPDGSGLSWKARKAPSDIAARAVRAYWFVRGHVHRGEHVVCGGRLLHSLRTPRSLESSRCTSSILSCSEDSPSSGVDSSS